MEEYKALILTARRPLETVGSTRTANLVLDPDGGWIYWTEFFNGIHRVTLDGKITQTIVPIAPVTIPAHQFPGRSQPTTILDRSDIQGIALDRINQLLYWGPDHPFESPLGQSM